MSRRRVKPRPSVEQTATAEVSLRIAGRPLHLRVSVPAAPVRRRALLPLFRQLADAVVDFAVEDAELAGERVSCTQGCGACCRQLVPITEPEAHALRQLLDEMPPARRAALEDRFADARRRLEDAGLLETLLAPATGTRKAGDLRELGLRYFALGIPCPFLEDESCSIHPDRPIACREYLVTSPAGNCAQPSAEGIRMVHISGKVSAAVSRAGSADNDPVRWVPLVVAPEWASRNNEEAAVPGRPLLESFFRRLALGTGEASS